MIARAAALSIAVVCVASPAAADESEAERAFREGRELMKQRKFAEACARLERSEALEPAVGTLTNLGICYEKLGKNASAWRKLNEAADLAAKLGQTDRAANVRAYADDLAPRVSRVVVRVVGPPPKGLAVTLDGRDITAELGTELPMDPGSYAIAATAPEAKRWDGEIAVTVAGRVFQVSVPALEPITTGPKPDPEVITEIAPPPTAYDHQRPWSRLQWTGLAVGAAGLVGLGVGTAFGLRARSKWNDSETECNADGRCSNAGLDLIDDARLSANIANVAIGAGVVMVATGAVLWFVGRGDKNDRAASVGIGPGGVAVRGRF